MSVVLDRPTGAKREWDEIVAALTRREVVQRGVLIGAAAVLGRADLANAATAEPGWKTIETAKGNVRIPTNPKRVVCVANYAMESLFDLGLKPIGVPGSLETEVLPRDAARYKGAAKIGDFWEISLEKVAALAPDLILGLDFEFNTPFYTKLTAIAPTALFPLTGTSDWARIAAKYSNAIGRKEQFDAIRSRYRARVASVRTDHADTLKQTRWAIVTAPKGQAALWYPGSSGGQVLRTLGFRFSSAVSGKPGNYKMISYEQLGQVADADAIFVYETPTLPTLKQQPTWKNLKAVQNSKVFALPQLFPLSYGNAIALVNQAEAALKHV